VTTTTHKTLRGPRGGLILCRRSLRREIDSQVFPGIQGGPLMHVIARRRFVPGSAAAGVKRTRKQIIRNAGRCRGDERNSFRLVSGGTDNHLMLVDVGARGLTGKDCQIALDEAG